MSYKWKKVTAAKLSYDYEKGKLPYTRFEFIVIHYTANDGDLAANNANFYAKYNKRYAGAHVFVDDHYAYKSVPLQYAAYAVGGAKYPMCEHDGGGKYYGKCNNYNSISIEMCDTLKDGKHDVSDATIQNTISIVKYYMNKYNIPADHVIRHWDVNGKPCPVYFTGKDNKAWAKFKKAIS